MIRYTCGMFVAVLLLLLTGNAAASTIIDTGTSNGGVGVFGEGPGNFETFGQVFIAPNGDNRLDSFSFRLEHTNGPDSNTEFYAYVMDWTGNSALGPVLYQSAIQSTSPLFPSYQTFTFNTGGLQLIGGNAYIAFLSNSMAGDGTSGGGFFNLGSVPYGGGTYFYLDNGTNFAGVYTPWNSSGGTSDLAFRAEFNAQAVSETGSSLLIFTGSLALLIMAASCGRW